MEDKSNETLEMIESHPLTKQIRGEQGAERLSKREAAHKALLDLQARRDSELPPLVEAKGKAASRLEKAKQKTMEAEQAFLNAKGELARADHAFKVEHGKHTGELTETYAPELGEAISWFHAKLDEIRKMKTDKQSFGQGRNLVTLKQTLTTYHNRPAILRAVGYCQEALRLLEDMKILPEFDAEAVEALKAGLPDPEELTEVTSERSFASEVDIHPFAHLKSDAQRDAEVADIMHRVELVKRQGSKGKPKKQKSKAQPELQAKKRGGGAWARRVWRSRLGHLLERDQ